MGVITERERQKYFAYLDGVADGLNESRNDVNSVLDKIRSEIEEERKGYPPSADEYKTINKVLQIIDKYKEESHV